MRRDFIAYFTALADKRKSSNFDNWISTLNHLVKFSTGNLKFGMLNESYCNSFKQYLLVTSNLRSKNKAPLARNSVVSYFNKFKAALKQAFKDGYLKSDLNAKIDSVKPAETRRNFLTIEELNKLIKTECSVTLLKKASLFSALTGLRFCDISKLKWNEIDFIKGNGYFINFTQQKTEGVEVLPISEQAYRLLGEPGEAGSKVFVGLKYSASLNKKLLKWLVKAGITKKITFHCFRHTYACLQLSEGTDIYTVSKMLGHRDLKTTQVYAKVISSTKRAASERIKLDF